MRVAFVSLNVHAPWGGSEELWSRAARLLAAEGHAVAALVSYHPRPADAVAGLARAGCPVAFAGRPRGLARRALARLGVGGRGDAERFLDAFRPELVVHSLTDNAAPAGLGPMEACRRRGAPYAVIVQAASRVFWPRDDALERFAACYAGARRCFFVSEENRRTTEVTLGQELPGAEVVRNPFNVRYDAAPPWPAGEGYRLACVGRLEPQAKGQDLLMEVLRQAKWRGRPLTVSLVGGGGNERALRRLAAAWGLGSVRFAGHRDDIEAVWAEHHGLVLPSRYEGLPLALVEAMLCGRVSVVTDVGGNAELVRDGETGVVAPAATAAALDEALERAWQRRERWQEMGRLAAQSVRRQVPADPARVLAERVAGLG